MPAQITVEEQQKGDPSQFCVTVTEGSSRTQHIVTVAKSYRDHLAGPEISTGQLVRKSFEFLLAREPKESILRSFDLRVISRYFPEYEQEIRKAVTSDK